MADEEDLATFGTLKVMNERLRTLQGYVAWIVGIGFVIALANLAALAIVVHELTQGPGFD